MGNRQQEPDNERSWKPRKELGLPPEGTGEPREGSEQGRGADGDFNPSGCLVVGGDGELVTREEAGDQGKAGARIWGSGIVSTQFRFTKHLAKDPEAHESSVLERSKEPGLSGTAGRNSHGCNPGRAIGQYPSNYL